MKPNNPLRPLRWYEKIFSKTLIARFLAKVIHHLDNPLMRWTNGKNSLTGIVTGLPMITLTTIGAKSGLPRTMPLLAIADENRYVLIASNFGGKHNPGWYYNLKANPHAEVSFEGVSKKYHARITADDEREGYWEMAVALYRGYAAYKKMAPHRNIPVIILESID